MCPKKNKAVILLCTIDDKGEIDGATNKSNIILDYNKTKGGVDMVDQMCASYSTQRITRRWPLAVFFRILDIAGMNSQIIFNNMQLLEKTPRRRKYLSELGVSLMEDHMKERAKINTLPKDIREFLSQYRVLEEQRNAENQNRSGRCRICSAHKNSKTTVSCDSCHQFVCKKHSTKTVQCNTCLYPPMEED
ncbi:hypothetical protein NQ314_019932 [Rhamnusium bicolor]|uniref:PiggyBac transposable element-derived protein domain-containing protein n=1 Tax=Rhamnusium bicolor TaxID=1586634 RepID=A0AAV8WLW3_9CUCU|nr:hypothetical protein NQ314_019932 [Rhamnusium bicolor]